MTYDKELVSAIVGDGSAKICDEICYLLQIVRTNNGYISLSLFPSGRQFISDLNDARGYIVAKTVDGGSVAEPNGLVGVVF